MIFAAIPFKLQQFGFAETNRVYACRLAASIVPPVDVCSHSAFQLYRTMYDALNWCIKLPQMKSTVWLNKRKRWTNKQKIVKKYFYVFSWKIFMNILNEWIKVVSLAPCNATQSVERWKCICAHMLQSFRIEWFLWKVIPASLHVRRHIQLMIFSQKKYEEIAIQFRKVFNRIALFC